MISIIIIINVIRIIYSSDYGLDSIIIITLILRGWLLLICYIVVGLLFYFDIIQFLKNIFDVLF